MRATFVAVVLANLVPPAGSVDHENRKLQPEYTPVFMFAGQSNIIGSPYETACGYTKDTGKGLCGADFEPKVFQAYESFTTVDDIRGQDLKSLVEVLRQGLPYKDATVALKNQALKVELGDTHVAWWEAANLLFLHSKYPDLFESILRPHGSVYCSWSKPAPKGWGTQLVEAEKLSTNGGCGDPWGLELTFGHTLSSFEEFGITKIADGGTTMRYDWTIADTTDPLSGRCLKSLRKQARSLAGAHPNCPKESDGKNCKWQGLVFFQGENDVFLDEAEVRTYGTGLKEFVKIARKGMFSNGADPSFATPRDIPVVIIELGCWPETISDENNAIVKKAQREFVEQDENSALVRTDDLSCYYHFDTASHLIIGERVARAMDGLLMQRVQ